MSEKGHPLPPNGIVQKVNHVLAQVEGLDNSAELIAPLQEILEEVQTWAEIQELEEKFRTVVEQANEAVIILQDGKRAYYNPRWLTMTGYSEKAYKKIPVFSLVHPEDIEIVKRVYDEVIAGQTPETTVIYRLIHKSGVTKHLYAKASRILWEGNPAVLVLIEDITQRQLAEEQLRQSKEKYQALFENMAQGSFYQAADGTLLDCNPAVLEIFGLTRDEFLSRTSLHPTWRVIHEDGSDFPGDQHPSMQALQTGKPVRDVVAGVYNPKRQDFSWLIINAFPVFNPGEEKPCQAFVTLHDITEKKKIEIALEERLVELDLAQKIANIGNWSFDPAVGVPEWSAVVYEIYERDPSLGPPHIDEYKIMYAPNQYQIFIDAIQNAIQNGAPYDIELELKLKDKTKWIHAICQPDQEKTPDGHFLRGTIQDITDRKLAEEQIIKAKLLLEETGRMARIGGWEIDLDTMEPYFSEETYRIYELPPDQPPPPIEEGINYFAPEARPIITEAVNEAIENKAPYDLELTFITSLGKEIWVQTQGKAYFEDGKPVRLYGTIQDITARKQAELQLTESEEKLRAIFENTMYAIIIADDLGNYTFANKAAADIFGYSEDELMNMNVSQIRTSLPPDAAELFKRYLKKEQEIGEFHYIRSDGEHRIAAYHAVRVNENFNLSILSDITDQTRTSKRLEKYTNRLEMAQEIGNIGTWNLDITNDVLEWTDQNYKIFGVELGKPMTVGKFFELVHPEDQEYVGKKWDAAQKGEDYDIQHRILVNGKVRWVREKAILNFDENGKATDAVGITADITRQKAAEEQIRKARNRARALAHKVVTAQEDERKHISREIHDEAGQLLTVLKIQLDMLYDDLPEEMESYRDQFIDATTLVDNTLESLRSMAQGLRPPSLDTLGLTTTLQNLCSEFTERLGLPVEFQAGPLPETDDVIIITLYRFAQEALTNIAKHSQASAVEVSLGELDNMIELQILDNGVGFKLTGKENHGIGLSGMSERLELVGGSLEVQSQPGGGVQITARVPVN